MSRALPNPTSRPRRRGRRRRRNPWTRRHTLAAVAGVVVVGTAAIVIRRMASRWDGKGGPSLDYVPHITSWPHQDRFGNEHAFGVQLQAWGYNVGPINEEPTWTIIDAQPMQAVMAFQRDYNLVRQIDLPTPTPSPELVEDGLIGHNTALAFWHAEQWAQQLNMTWPQLVELAHGEIGDS